MLCLAKGLTSGFPLSVCIGTDEVMGAWGMSAGEALHTSTFLGHPVGCAAGLAVIDLFAEHDLLGTARHLGEEMGQGLEALRSRHSGRIGEVRGLGAMRGLEMLQSEDAMKGCRAMLEQGYLVLPSGEHGEVISMTPSLTMTRAQWGGALAALERVL